MICLSVLNWTNLKWNYHHYTTNISLSQHEWLDGEKSNIFCWIEANWITVGWNTANWNTCLKSHFVWYLCCYCWRDSVLLDRPPYLLVVMFSNPDRVRLKTCIHCFPARRSALRNCMNWKIWWCWLVNLPAPRPQAGQVKINCTPSFSSFLL